MFVNFSHISHVHISKRNRPFNVRNLDILFSCEDEDIGRFSKLY